MSKHMKTMRWLSLSLVFVALATQFTNCGNYADPMNYSSPGPVDCSTDEDCIIPTINNVSLKVNFGGGTEYSVPVDMAEFNLGGDCNEGGYPYNTIRWELYLGGVMVRHSGMGGFDSRCINGRFLIYVYLGAIAAGDNFNRSGLYTPQGVRAPYDLWIEVYGQETPGGVPQKNSLKGKMRISLIAI